MGRCWNENVVLEDQNDNARERIGEIEMCALYNYVVHDEIALPHVVRSRFIL